MLIQLRELALHAVGQSDVVRRRRRVGVEACLTAIRDPIDALAIFGHRRGEQLPALSRVQLDVVRVDLFLSLLLLGSHRRPVRP
jgi:hypothetical protein